MNNQAFLTQLAKDEAWHKYFIEYFENQRIKITKSEGLNADYDYKFEKFDTSWTVEAKVDYRAAETGNIFVETGKIMFSTGEYIETGINVSKSDYYVYQVIMNGYIKEYWLKPDDIKKHFNKNNERRFKAENKYNIGHIIKIDSLGVKPRIYAIKK